MALGTALAVAGIGTKLLGGLFGKKAAKSAAQVQQDAAAKAGQQAQQVVRDTNPLITEAAAKAGNDALGAADRAATTNEEATAKANAFLNPYSTAGTTAADALNKGIATGGEFNRAPTKDDIMIDPGFDFRYQNAQRDFENFAGAHGGVDNGGAVRDFETFRQGLRSQEFAAAYDRFLKSSQNRFSNVFNVAGMGQQAAGQMGSNLIGSSIYGGDKRTQATQYAGDKNFGATTLTTGRTVDAQNQANEFSLQGANANAAGKVAGSNAVWNGINGAVDYATDLYALNQSGGESGRGQSSSGNMFSRWFQVAPQKTGGRWAAPANPGYGDALGGTA